MLDLGYNIGMEINIVFTEKGPSEVKIDGVEYSIHGVVDNTPVGKTWIAKYLGVTLRALYQKPWFFPDFGEGFKTSKKPYTASQMKEWLSIPLQKRKDMYKQYLNKEG